MLSVPVDGVYGLVGIMVEGPWGIWWYRLAARETVLRHGVVDAPSPEENGKFRIVMPLYHGENAVE